MEELQAQIRGMYVSGLRDKLHGKYTRGKALDSKGNAAVLAVNNWSALKLLHLEPSTPDCNVTAQFNESLVAEAEAALMVDEDADKLLECLLLILKAVRRG